MTDEQGIPIANATISVSGINHGVKTGTCVHTSTPTPFGQGLNRVWSWQVSPGLPKSLFWMPPERVCSKQRDSWVVPAGSQRGGLGPEASLRH